MQPSKDRPLLALAWMALSALGFSLMAIAVKRVGRGIPEFELVFFRSTINFLLVLAVMLARREKLFPEPGIHRLLIYRGITGFIGVSCLFYTLNHLPLPIAMLIGWCSPLFVMLFSRIFLGEKLPERAWLGISIAFGGLVLVLSPDFHHGGLALGVGAVGIGLLGAASSGSAYVAIRAATARVGSNLIVLYFMFVSGLIAAPLAIVDFRWPNGVQLLEILALGIFATVGQVTMTQGYRHAPAGMVSTISLLTAGFSAVFGWLIFDERLSLQQWTGMIILSMGIGALTWRAKKSRVDTSGDATGRKLGYERKDALQE